MWVVAALIAVFGMIVLAGCASRVAREIDPTYRSIAKFGSELRPALLRVRDETARTRGRFDPDA